jgi:hypothetical protein
MDAEGLANDLAALMDGMPKGLYLLLCTAIDQLGGDLRVDPEAFVGRLRETPPQMELRVEGDTIVLRPVTAANA